MKTYQELQSTYLNRSVALANFYQKNSIKLIELILNHNKQSIQAAHQRATNLIGVKDIHGVNKMIAKDVSEQMKEYTHFATSAYLLGSESQASMVEAFQDHVRDHISLANSTIENAASTHHPINSILMSVANGALAASKSAISTAKASSKT